VRAVTARAEDIDESWGRFELVTAGRAFHWFDKDLILARLVTMTPAIALVGDDLRDSEAQSRALIIAVEVMGERPIEQPRNGRRHLDRHLELLRASAFSAVEVISVEVERTWTPDELIGLCYSTSLASTERLREKVSTFEQRVRDELAPIYREHVTVDAVIGRRH